MGEKAEKPNEYHQPESISHSNSSSANQPARNLEQFEEKQANQEDELL
jgi:hypothetical protein